MFIFLSVESQKLESSAINISFVHVDIEKPSMSVYR